MTPKQPVPAPPQLAKLGLKRIVTNLPPDKKLEIDMRAFACVFSEELSDFVRNIEKYREAAREESEPEKPPK